MSYGYLHYYIIVNAFGTQNLIKSNLFRNVEDYCFDWQIERQIGKSVLQHFWGLGIVSERERERERSHILYTYISQRPITVLASSYNSGHDRAL